VPGVASFAAAIIGRLRFSNLEGDLLGVSLGVSASGGAASSRARVLVRPSRFRRMRCAEPRVRVRIILGYIGFGIQLVSAPLSLFSSRLQIFGCTA
jgi:hypothetical protein